MKKSILAGVIALTLSGGAWTAVTAQQTEAPVSPTSPGSMERASEATMQARQIRASELIDQEVRNLQDEQIGTIDDLVITLKPREALTPEAPETEAPTPEAPAQEPGVSTQEPGAMTQEKEGKAQIKAVISVGGFLGVGERLVAVPLDELQIKPDEDYVVYDATKEQLEAQPEFKYEEDESGLFGTGSEEKREGTEERSY